SQRPPGDQSRHASQTQGRPFAVTSRSSYGVARGRRGDPGRGRHAGGDLRASPPTQSVPRPAATTRGSPRPGLPLAGGRLAEGGRRPRRPRLARRRGHADPGGPRRPFDHGVSGRGGAAPAGCHAAAGATRSVDRARPRRLRQRADGRYRPARRSGAGAGGKVEREPVSFARPVLLLALLLLPLWWWLRGRRLARVQAAPLSDARPMAVGGTRTWMARLPATLRSCCLGAWVIAASGPRFGSARAEVKSEGISIVVAIDLSSSMLAEDFAPSNRIDVAKRTAIDFVHARSSDRIALVAFAAQALTQVPLTTDYAVLDQALQ